MSSPLNNLTDTWANGATVFTGLKYNITNTASAAGSLLIDLQIGSTSIFSVNKFGGVFAVPAGGGGTSGFWFGSAAQFPALGIEGGSNQIIFNANSGNIGGVSYFASLSPGTGGLVMGIARVIGFGSSFTAPDAYFTRDAAGIIAQANTTNAQTLRVYNTYTDSSNYERGVFDWATTANTLTIGTQQAGTGTLRTIAIVGGGINQLGVFFVSNSTGNSTIHGSFVFNFGSSGLSTPDVGISRSAAGVLAFGNGTAQGNSSATILAKTKAGAPTTSDVPAETWAVIRDTTNNTTKVYYNNAGTLMSVALT